MYRAAPAGVSNKIMKHGALYINARSMHLNVPC